MRLSSCTLHYVLKGAATDTIEYKQMQQNVMNVIKLLELTNEVYSALAAPPQLFCTVLRLITLPRRLITQRFPSGASAIIWHAEISC